ncbi:MULTISPECIES: hypothetical protein [unclassified Nostoc]|uniref:hypothetical protein n=1 Tax=unclassified Nostoc TaxID=2593658 RepID=UPI0026301A6C|nr:hypothetical protein [Nostoc sp. S13]MDF5738212.1 hypothetical protein [Nostoc sp. S13]
MKDNLTLIAAATGGFILSVALAGILRGAPITAWHEQSSFRTTNVANLQKSELKAPRFLPTADAARTDRG